MCDVELEVKLDASTHKLQFSRGAIVVNGHYSRGRPLYELWSSLVFGKRSRIKSVTLILPSSFELQHGKCP